MASVAWEILKTVEPGTRFVASLMEVSYALINLRQALKRIPPLIEQLDTRLKNLTFFLASIHELKPKNIAIRTVFDQADSRLSETFEDFKKFCDQYNKRGAVRKFVLSINDEQFLRQCGRVIGEATQELSFSLQVSEYQIVEEQTDMLTLCLQKLKENENSNADLLNEIENSMSRGLRKVNEDSGKVVKIVEGLTGKLIGLEDHVKEIKDKMESLPRYLENVKNDDVKELWNSRHWEDSVLIDRFLKGYLEFVQSKNPGMNRKLLTILLSRTGKRLEEKLRHQLGKSNSVIFVSPADLDIPYDVSLKDLFLWSEMGWRVITEVQLQELQELSASFEFDPHKLNRLLSHFETFFNSISNVYPIDEDQISSILDTHQTLNSRPSVLEKMWSPVELELVNIMKELKEHINKDPLSFVLESNLIPTSPGPMSEKFDSVQFYKRYYDRLSMVASSILNQLEVPWLDETGRSGSVENLKNLVHEDVEKDEKHNSETMLKFKNVVDVLNELKRSFSRCSFISPQSFRQPWDRLNFPSSASSSNEATFTPNAKLKASLRGRSVLIHPLPYSIYTPLPTSILDQLRRFLALPHHDNMLNILGFTSYNSNWAIITDFISPSFSTLKSQLTQIKELDITSKVEIMLEICNATMFLAENDVVHGGLHSSAVWLGKRRTLKIVPLVEGLLLEENHSEDTDYRDPECKKGKELNASSDIWSLGCLIYAILSGNDPFPASDSADTMSQSYYLKPDGLPVPDGTISDLRLVYNSCLQLDPERRIGAEEVLDQLESVLKTLEMIEKAKQEVAQHPPRTVFNKTSNAASVTNGRTTSLYSVSDSTSMISQTSNPPPYSITSAQTDNPSDLRLTPSLIMKISSHPNYLHAVLSAPVPRNLANVSHINQLAHAVKELENGQINLALNTLSSANTYGQHESLCLLGHIYYYGNLGDPRIPVESNPGFAFRYYYSATKHGLPMGHIGLADCYLFNLGIPEQMSLHDRISNARHHYELIMSSNPDFQNCPRLLCGLADIEYYSSFLASSNTTSSSSTGSSTSVIPRLSDRAQALYNRALSIVPNYYRALIGVADSWVSRKLYDKYDDAMEVYLSVADAVNLRRAFLGMAGLSREKGDVTTEWEYRMRADQARDF